ncbi:tRNA (adenine(22)-N(1))-methyltransferase [Streptococcus halotolerans]|uniref:tRNA (adenine(22)-N(1))-methyltransferase n=1 Tax=Streptococcus halotolerans TaxID=1814128 RepID=UPI000786856E|nr:tRNA (adenine(22)-N(1))-methyltransferase TrmK [Streptococcus halotolerans]
MEIQLSKRLAEVAKFVPKDAVLLDVGSDHAYLPIALLEQNVINRAIAGEVVEGPYQSAIKNVQSSNLSDKIEVRLANGLAAFESSDQVTTITICGMGGRLISDILEEGKEKLRAIERLILQPNNREDDLRHWLQENDFQIVSEIIMTENNKYYEIIVAEHGSMTLTSRELRFGPHLLKEKTTIFKQKWQREWDKLAYAHSSVPEDKKIEREILMTKMKEIKEVIENAS